MYCFLMYSVPRILWKRNVELKLHLLHFIQRQLCIFPKGENFNDRGGGREFELLSPAHSFENALMMPFSV